VKSLQFEPQLNVRYRGLLGEYLKSNFATRQLANNCSSWTGALEQLMTSGELSFVSADATPAQAEEPRDAAPMSAMPGYKGIVKLKAQTLRGGMGELPISAGMQLTAEIIEGDRTVMEYLLSPVQRVASEAGRER
jgi:multidrug efflux pump subunit AcrA (membrane-fusion protein)